MLVVKALVAVGALLAAVAGYSAVSTEERAKEEFARIDSRR
ncbi:hypothetical protein ABH931_006991 [Streptacidiphilus sp. MAP12-33]